MAVDFALPVGHDPTQLSTISLCIGRPFRQPVDISNDTNDVNYNGNFSQGIEIWLNDTTSERKIFSMFDGIISYSPGNNSTANILTLQVSEETQNEINKDHQSLEPMPFKIIYENVGGSEVENAMTSLISTAYANVDPSDSFGVSWHPVLHSFTRVFPYNSMKVQLDNAYSNGGTTGLNTEIQNIVNSFLSGDINIIVKAGDEIGSAATPSSSEALPQNCTTNLTLNNSRRVTIITEEYAQNRLNPKYYLWRLLTNVYANTGKHVNLITFTNTVGSNGNKFDHPLLAALNIDKSITQETLPNDTLPRVTITLPNQTNPVILFPVGKLGEYHGYSAGNHDSAIEWRIKNSGNLNFETIIRQGTPTTLGGRPIGICSETANNKIDVCPDPLTANSNKVNTIWSDYANEINEICYILQFPAEYLISSIGIESNYNANPRSLALEKFFSYHILACQQAGVSQSIIDAYISLTKAGKGYGLIAPDPFDSTAFVNPSLPSPVPTNYTGNTLTWEQLHQIINVSQSVPVPPKNNHRVVSPTERMSPGLVQTLVSTARRLGINTLTTIYQDIPSTFNVQAVPNDEAGLFFWLLTARHSILAAVATHKYNYVNRKSALDLPKVGATYNAGSLYPADPLRGTSIRNPWLMEFYGLYYPLESTRYYNAVRNNTNILSQVRLYKSL